MKKTFIKLDAPRDKAVLFIALVLTAAVLLLCFRTAGDGSVPVFAVSGEENTPSGLFGLICGSAG